MADCYANLQNLQNWNDRGTLSNQNRYSKELFMTAFDVVTLGETMLRLTPPDFKLMEQADMLTIRVGGSESNTAVGLARLGMKVCWISRMTNNVLGHYIVDAIHRHGVDTSSVIWTDEDRVGLYFMQEGKPPRSSSVLYDRRYSAMSRIQPQELPDTFFKTDTARLLHLTGITPAISASARETAFSALNRAKAAGWRVSFDVNYRANLWTESEASECCKAFMREANLIFCPLTDATRLFGVSTQPFEALESLHHVYPTAFIVLTLGADGAVACDSHGTVYQQRAFAAERVDRVGGGDAFNAGFLYGYLSTGGQLPMALQWGAAVAAFKYTIPGDLPLVHYEEVARLVQQGGSATNIMR
jgi:2-dehydro-3-deoxygluconokinase